VDSGGLKEARITWGAHWRNPANTTEKSMCSGDAAFLSNHFDHWQYYTYVDAAYCYRPSRLVSPAKTLN